MLKLPDGQATCANCLMDKLLVCKSQQSFGSNTHAQNKRTIEVSWRFEAAVVCSETVVVIHSLKWHSCKQLIASHDKPCLSLTPQQRAWAQEVLVRAQGWRERR